MTVQRRKQAHKACKLTPEVIDWIKQGIVPKQQLCNIQYQDFIKALLETVVRIYDYFNLELPEESKQAMR